jgi:glucose/arabinose dehydrogenase/RNase P/RNase MRP subunit p29
VVAGGVTAFVALLGPTGRVPPTPADAQAATLPSGFSEAVVFSGLVNPTVVRFASDGRVFVAEKSGLIKVFDNLSDTTPTVFADLRTNVHNFWDRGLLGMALDPNFPTQPYVYALYTYDHMLGSAAAPPRWGTIGATSDGCPTPPGPTTDGCVVSGRLSRLQASGNVMTGPEQVLVEDWCQQMPSHSMGTIEFGSDGALYASGGDGASFFDVDFGQFGSPRNPCGDPPTGSGGTQTAPSAEGGALRSQDLRTTGDPTGLDGSVIRVDPATGASLPNNPLSLSPDANARRIVAYGFRNPFRFTFKPGTTDLWVGDVGWNDWEEIDHDPTPTTGPLDFGWPCYEGNGRQSGFDGTNLTLCENFYAAGGTTAPHYTYKHADLVVPGESCPTGSSSISGLAFTPQTGSAYPAAYDGALFFADYSRNCIWVMKKGANGDPSPANIETFDAGAAGPVNLQFGPDGNLYYPDFNGGTIRRIEFAGSPPPPSSCPKNQFDAQYFVNKTLSGTPTIDRCETTIDNDWGAGGPGGGVPVDGFSVRWAGQFDFAGGSTTFSATADDGIRVWVDGSILIDKWIDQGPTTYSATRTLTAGTHDVKVEYYENGGGAVARVSWTGGAAPPPSCPTGQYRAQYFPNRTLSGTPTISRCETAINNAWGSGGPGGGIANNNFSVRWTGTFNFQAGSSTFSVTADDGMRLWVDGNLLIDKWVDQSGVTYTANSTLTGGLHDVKVEYYENTGTATAKASWTTVPSGNQPPQPAIATPNASTPKWKVGDTISFSGSATDPEDGTLAASRLSWSLVMQHCPSNCHSHLLQTFDGVASGSFSAPDHEYPSYLELTLTATDSAGLTASTTVRIDPATVDLSFASTPSGLQLVFNGASQATPFTKTVIVGSNNGVTATAPQTLSGTTYSFSGWTDGGAQTRTITAPATATTYTATYTAQAPTTCPQNQFLAQYYANPLLTGTPTITRCEGTIDNDWGPGGPGGGVPIDGFSVRWAGSFDFPAGDTTFTATADDGVRLWVDGVLVIDKWIDETATTYTATRTLTAGSHDVRLEYYENTDSATARLVWSLASGPPPPCPGQFQAQYFANISLAGAAALTRCEPAIDNDWGAGGPGNGVPNDNFSVRWTGSFTFPAGDATFSVTADDGIRLWVDGVLLIDKWIDQGPTTYTATRTLTAGSHDLKVEYYEKGGGAVARASWTTSGAPTSPCANEVFYAEYWKNRTLTGAPTLTRCETAVNNTWGAGGPGNGIPNDSFSTRWSGTFTFPAGSTTFRVTADDGIRLWVDGVLLIDKWIDQGSTTYTAARTLTAGTHTVKVEYYENGGDATAIANWTTP